MEQYVETLSQHLRRLEKGFPVLVTGAGVSLASGIPTFRGTDPGAIWKRDVTELGTLHYFLSDPAGSWSWYLSRFDRVFQARPNPAHHAMAKLERWFGERGGRFLLVTQNVDILHEQAGSRRLVKVHGSADRVRCSRDGCRCGAPRGSLPRDQFDLTAFENDPRVENLPRCPDCSSLLRQHVLWFDEYYTSHDDYQFELVQEAAMEMDLVIFAGTSFSVGVTDLLLRSAFARGIPAFSIDPCAGSDLSPLQVLPVPAEELLPATCAALGIDAPEGPPPADPSD